MRKPVADMARAIAKDAARELQTALRDATERYCREHGIADPAGYGIAEIALAGWSATERRMRLWYFFNADDYQAQDDGGEHYGMLSMPRLDPDVMPKPAGSIDQQLVAIMLAEQEQFRTHREEMGGARLGGEIQAWTVTPEGISQRVIYRFPDYEATLHAGAAVAQRIIRGDEVVDVAAGLVPVGEMRAAGDDARGAASAQGVTRAERRRQERAARKAARRAA